MVKKIMFVLAALLVSPSLYAAEFFCAAGNVTCLIAAINQANGTPEEDTINLEPGIYTLTTIDNGGVPPPFPLFSEGANGLPLITSRIIIRGTAPESTIIERDPAAPAFRLLEVAGTGTLTLSRLTLQGGTAVDFRFWGGMQPGNGGAVFNGGTLAIDDTILTKNSATGGTGGEGGAIFNNGAATIANSSMDVNSSASNRFSLGGAIENVGSLSIINSSLAGNVAFAASGSGGAINNSGTLTITNTTFAGNSVDAAVSMPQGGAIRNSGTLTIINSTLAGNFAGVKNPSGPAQGGGLYNNAVVNVQNTIVAGNSISTFPGFGRGPDCFGPLTSLDHSLIGDPTDCTVVLGPDDRTGDPGLGEFTDDGTPGNGHFPLLKTSPAIDAGNNDLCSKNPVLATDQIGNPRIGVCDIGAIEFSLPGDVNGDGTVDCADLAIVRSAFGKHSGQAQYDARADVNKDGIVDVRDLAFVSQRLPAGTHCQ